MADTATGEQSVLQDETFPSMSEVSCGSTTPIDCLEGLRSESLEDSTLPTARDVSRHENGIRCFNQELLFFVAPNLKSHDLRDTSSQAHDRFLEDVHAAHQDVPEHARNSLTMYKALQSGSSPKSRWASGDGGWPDRAYSTAFDTEHKHHRCSPIRLDEHAFIEIDEDTDSIENDMDLVRTTGWRTARDNTAGGRGGQSGRVRKTQRTRRQNRKPSEKRSSGNQIG